MIMEIIKLNKHCFCGCDFKYTKQDINIQLTISNSIDYKPVGHKTRFFKKYRKQDREIISTIVEHKFVNCPICNEEIEITNKVLQKNEGILIPGEWTKEW